MGGIGAYRYFIFPTLSPDLQTSYKYIPSASPRITEAVEATRDIDCQTITYTSITEIPSPKSNLILYLGSKICSYNAAKIVIGINAYGIHNDSKTLDPLYYDHNTLLTNFHRCWLTYTKENLQQTIYRNYSNTILSPAVNEFAKILLKTKPSTFKKMSILTKLAREKVNKCNIKVSRLSTLKKIIVKYMLLICYDIWHDLINFLIDNSLHFQKKYPVKLTYLTTTVSVAGVQSGLNTWFFVQADSQEILLRTFSIAIQVMDFIVAYSKSVME